MCLLVSSYTPHTNKLVVKSFHLHCSATIAAPVIETGSDAPNTILDEGVVRDDHHDDHDDCDPELADTNSQLEFEHPVATSSSSVCSAESILPQSMVDNIAQGNIVSSFAIIMELIKAIKNY